MNINTQLILPPNMLDPRAVNGLYRSITQVATKESFLENWTNYPQVSFDTADTLNWLTPLHLAADNQNVELIELIVSIGGDALMNYGDRWGRLPIHRAASNMHHTENGYLATKKLIELKSPLNVRGINCANNQLNFTPLENSLYLHATGKQDLQISALLLKNGAQAAIMQHQYGEDIVDITASLEAAKAQAKTEMKDVSLLFKMAADSKESTLKALPPEITNIIFSMNANIVNNTKF